MVEYKNQDLDQIFYALSDATRRDILLHLKSEPKRVTDLAGYYDMSMNAVSKHIKVLDKAELIERSIHGRVHLCNIRAERLREIETWMDLYRGMWEERLDALEDFLVKNKKGKTNE